MLQKTVFSLELMNLTFWHPTGGGTNEWIPNASTIGLSHLRCHLYNLELVNCKVFCEILKDSFIASKYIRSMHFGKMEAPANSTLWILNLVNFKFPICNQNLPLQFFDCIHHTVFIESQYFKASLESTLPNLNFLAVILS